MKKILYNKGFTLIELIVVIVIIGILTTIAGVKYGKSYIHKARALEFQTVLSAIFTAEGAYEAENGSYYSGSDLNVLDVTIPKSKHFSYSINASADQFTATATIKKRFGKATTTDSATIDHLGNKTVTKNLSMYAPNWAID